MVIINVTDNENNRSKTKAKKIKTERRKGVAQVIAKV